jgi:hypothetical protein
MTMPWMIPLALLIGIAGTRTSQRARRGVKGTGRGWWLLLILAWLPGVCWALSQVVTQYP